MLKLLEPGGLSIFPDGGRQLSMDTGKSSIIVRKGEVYGDVAWQLCKKRQSRMDGK